MIKGVTNDPSVYEGYRLLHQHNGKRKRWQIVVPEVSAARLNPHPGRVWDTSGSGSLTLKDSSAVCDRLRPVPLYLANA